MGLESKPIINFLRGWPSPHLLPPKLLLSAAAHTLSTPDLSSPALEYAPDEGDATLRRQLAGFLGAFYRRATDPPAAASGGGGGGGGSGGTVDPARVAVTGGASQSLAVLLAVATDPGYTRGVWAVEPTYFLACRIFDDAGLRVRGVPEGRGGVDIVALRERLREAERDRREALRGAVDQPAYKPITRSWPSHIYKHVIYAVPSFSNPTGRCMTLSCREDLVVLAREYDALIICDDVYDFLWWPADEVPEEQHDDTPSSSHFRAVVPRLVDVDRDLPGTTPFGNVVSNGSFSKICAPGVRTGWVEATPPLAHAISQAGASRSGGAASGVVANVLGEALASGALQRHVAQVLRPAYARRWAYMCDAVHEHLVPLGASLPFARVDVRALYDGRGPRGRGAEVVPEGLLPAAVAGGYFVYVRLPPGISAAVLAARAEKRAGVVVQTEGMCLVPRVAGTSGELKGVPGGEGDRHVRLCFAWEDETVLVEGIHRLAGILRDILDGDDGPPFESVDRSGSAYS